MKSVLWLKNTSCFEVILDISCKIAHVVISAKHVGFKHVENIDSDLRYPNTDSLIYALYHTQRFEWSKCVDITTTVVCTKFTQHTEKVSVFFFPFGEGCYLFQVMDHQAPFQTLWSDVVSSRRVEYRQNLNENPDLLPVEVEYWCEWSKWKFDKYTGKVLCSTSSARPAGWRRACDQERARSDRN